MLENCKAVTSLHSGDFSTLYTMLPHSDVVKQLYWLCDKLFNNCGKHYIVLGYMNTYYSNELPKKDVALDCMQVKDLITSVLGNSFVVFGGCAFQQIQGVPMGGNASPQIADLTLSCYEFKFLTNRQNFSIAKKLHASRRYVDDLINVNHPNFIDICASIYPACLPLSDTSLTSGDCNYLDLFITANDGAPSIDVYNKTDAFAFKVLRFVHADSNVATALGYNVFFSQLHRIATICSTAGNFKQRLKDMVDEFLNKHYGIPKLEEKFWLFCVRYRALASKFGLVGKDKCLHFFRSTNK